ncbi:MAG: hypothetical protein ABJL44_13360 [Algibacter sp.]
MFDSVAPGGEVTDENQIAISLEIGTYEMRTQEFKPDKNTHLRLQQLTLVI